MECSAKEGRWEHLMAAALASWAFRS